jgi:hypothetical protein
MPSANALWLGDARWKLARPICGIFRLYPHPPASTDYCSCQVLRENHFSCDFPSVTGPKTKSVDRDLALRAYFFILQDDLFHI